MRRLMIGLALVAGIWTVTAAQQQQPSTSRTADMRLWAKNTEGAWVPVELDSNGNLPTSATGGDPGTAQQQQPSTSSTVDARLWALNPDGVYVPVELDSSGRLPMTGTFAPTDAQYWTGAADATLSAEKNLGALGTGLVINTAGVPSAFAGTSCTNQFPRSLNASGAATCAQFVNVIPATDNVDLYMRMSTDGGSSYDSGANYQDARSGANTNNALTGGGATGLSAIRIQVGIDNAATSSLNGTLRLYNPGSTVVHKSVTGHVNNLGNDTFRYINSIGGWYISVTAVNAVQFLMSSGNIGSGSIRVLGVAKS